MYEKLTTKTLVYESSIFKYYFHTLYEKSTTHFFVRIANPLATRVF